MSHWSADLAKSLIEGVLDLLDAFAHVRPRTYFVVAILVLAVTAFAAFGPNV